MASGPACYDPRMLKWLERLYVDIAAGRRGPSQPAMRWLAETMHVCVVLWRESREDRLPVRAAMLAYWTAVAIVPILLLGFSLIGPLGLGDASRDAVRRLLYDTILAESVEDVGSALDTLLSSADVRTLGIVGIVGFMAIGSQLYFNAELAYNDIFRTRVRRSLMLRFALFYAGITLAPTLVAAGFVLTASMPDQVTVFRRGLPVLLTAMALVSAIRLLPSRDVSWRSSIIGGLFSAVAFEAAKSGFGTYTALMGTRDSLASIYGSLAFLPVFLLWLDVLWMTVLVGVEVAFLSEHYDLLITAQRHAVGDPFIAHRHPDSMFALAVMGLVARAWLDGDAPVHVDHLVALAGTDPRHVHSVLDSLEDSGLIVETDGKHYMPASPPQTMSAATILSRWRATTAPSVNAVTASTIGAAQALSLHLMQEPGAWIPSASGEVHRLPTVPLDKRLDRPPGV